MTSPLIKNATKMAKTKLRQMTTIANIIANQRDRAKAYRKESSVVPVPPLKIWVEPTNVCTLRCIHCIQPQMTRKKGYMDFALFKKIVDEASLHNIDLALSGQGEPLLHREYGAMVKYASKRCWTGVVTNATRLNEEAAREILDAEPDMVEFSFDAPTKKIYERICKGSNYEKTLENIMGFLDLKRKSGKKRPRTVIAIVKEPATENEIDKFKSWCRTLSVDDVLVQGLGNFQGESELWRSGEVTDKDVKDYLPKSEWPVCINPWMQIKINWDGTVNSCLWDYNNKFVIGNVGENAIMEIWNGDKMRGFREALATNQYDRVEQDGPLCSKCNILWWRRRFDYPRSAKIYFGYYLLSIFKKTGLLGLYLKLSRGIK